MLYDNLPLPLPWYSTIQQQDRFRQNVASDPKIHQIAPNNGLLPFMVKKNAAAELPYRWTIRCMGNGTLQEYIDGAEDPVVVDLSAFIVPALAGANRDGFDYIFFTQDKNALNLIIPTLPDGLPAGVYYMEMAFSDHTLGDLPGWCSETFRVPDDAFDWDTPGDVNYLTLKFRHGNDLRPIHYDDDPLDMSGELQGFYNILYLDTMVTASEPLMVKDIEEDGMREEHIKFHKAVIKYRVSVVVPDYLKIALYLLQMHDYRYLTTEKGIRTGEIKNMEVSSSLTTDGALSSVEVLFEQMVLIKNTNCADEMEEPEAVGYGDLGTLTSDFCEPSGSICIEIDALPAGDFYLELQGRVGVGAWEVAYPYISKADALAGICLTIEAGSGYTSFRLVSRTFDFYTGDDSTISVPTPSC